MDSRTIEFVQDVIITIHVNIRELKERKNFADPEEQSYIDGKLQAYNEMISILRSSAKEFQLPVEDLGL
jgi:hypothetical protein